jgi:hypothetical protein
MLGETRNPNSRTLHRVISLPGVAHKVNANPLQSVMIGNVVSVESASSTVCPVLESQTVDSLEFLFIIRHENQVV